MNEINFTLSCFFMKACAPEMGFGFEENGSFIVIPSDYSWYIMWGFFIVVFLLIFKITYRYMTSFNAEYAVYNNTKKTVPSGKKKRF